MKWLVVILFLSLGLTACTYPEEPNMEDAQNKIAVLQTYRGHSCDQDAGTSRTNGVARCTD